MNKLKKILVTGGTGYIGTHSTVILMQAGIDVVVLDNLCNSSSVVLKRIAQLTGKAPCFIKGDVRDTKLLDKIFLEHQIDAVIHFAGLKATEISTIQPLKYYNINVSGTIALCQSMKKAKIFTLIFSSSATVYGNPKNIPLSEDHPIGSTTNPYGTSKFIVEKILNDLVKSNRKWCIGILRYFNPIGAHESGIIGEDAKGTPNNLMPYLMKVALGKIPTLSVYGNDYPTIDGTGIRDYIHVVDLAKGHLAALNKVKNKSGLNVWNLGTGKGYSVFQVIKAFEIVSEKKLPYKIEARRDGDVAICYSNPSKAALDLNWTAELDLHIMIRDAWNWQKLHPNGYQTYSSL